MPHILLVEDEEHLAIGIRFNLEAEGFRVTTAGDGQTALGLLEDPEQAVDLVVLDLMLPGMSGYAVCEAIRGKQNDVPIVMLTARTLVEDRIRGFDAGTDVYLQKPFDLDEFDHVAFGISPDHEVIVYCACPNDASAVKVAGILRQRGFKRVRPLAGGIDAWTAAGFGLEDLK
jgi:CheY-like chemotaxis protein